ncbi:MAG: hypothetical protein U9P90_04135, partial [Patescibacteria group bacterium]|nr:hypothetical protein [Patescibacteria group bacterium]
MIIKKRRIYILFFITGFFLAWAVGASGFEIVDVQTTGDEGLSDECVKIKNTRDAPFSLLGLILQSHSSNPDSNRWTSRSGDGLPEIIMEPNEMIILASSDYSGDDYAWKHTVSWGLSDNGGGMRIVQKNDDGNIVTIFAEKYWGSLEEIEPEP